MFHIIIRNPLNYTLLYEGTHPTIQSIVDNLKKEYPHNKIITYHKLKDIIYRPKQKIDYIEVKNLNPKKKHS
jgi:hypothetical protein